MDEAGEKQYGNGSTRIQMLSSLTWAFDGTKLQVLRRLQKRARRLIITTDPTQLHWFVSEISWSWEEDEPRTPMHEPNKRQGTHDSEPRYQGIPLEKLRIDRQASRHCMRLLKSISLWGNFSLKTKNHKKYHAQAFLLQHFSAERNKLEVLTVNLT